MKLTDIVSVILVAMIFGYPVPSVAAEMQKIDAQLRATIESSGNNDLLSALLVLEDNASIGVEAGILARRQPSAQSRYLTAYHQLQQRTRVSQSELINVLREGVREGSVAEFKPYWITNAVYVLAAPEELLRLASHGDVGWVIPDLQVRLIEPVARFTAVADNQGPAENLLAVGARALWERGLTGAGRIICSFDTGVEVSHPALVSKWRGNHNADSAACWFDPYGTTFPTDGGDSHGTHVMGIMVGNDGADTIGLAPGAQWICAAVVDRGETLGQSISDILDAFEWAANPDGDPETFADVPDVVCNSWGIPEGFINQCGETFWNAIDNLESLGIVCVFAAGNEGPDSKSMRNPADRASSPVNCFAVGAVNSSEPGFPVASFSSRGPSSCDLAAKKPEVVAPGMAIRSSSKDGGYKLISGTSMATPHVAAAVALFRQYNPNLTPEQIKSAILLSAIDIEEPGEDNESGMGFIDLAAALELLPKPMIPDPQIERVRFQDGGNNLLDPGDEGNLVVTLHGAGIDAENLVGYLLTTTPGIELTKGTAYFGLVPADGFGDNAEDPFAFTAAPSFAPGDTVSFTLVLVGDNIPGCLQREFDLIFGVPDHGEWATLDNGTVAMTVSNFGVFGLHDESYMPLGGRGYEIPEGWGNFLFEAGLLIKAGAGPVSDEIRTDGIGEYSGDFKPSANVQMVHAAPGAIGDLESITSFDDSGAGVGLGVAVRQRAAAFSGASSGGGILVEWTITNTSGAVLDELCVGLFSDWDIPGEYQADLIVLDAGADLFYQHRGGSTPVVGVAMLNVPMNAARFYDNGSGKRGFSEFEKREALSGPISAPAESAAADWCGFVAAGPYDLAAGDSIIVAFAFCSSQSVADFYATAAEARNKYLLATGATEEDHGLPREHDLVVYPNYPNPFNPETRIDFVMPADGCVEAGIFNILGRKVTTLCAGYYPAGAHTVVWKGLDEMGRRMASGIYLCRVSTKTQTRTQKMVLIR